MRTTRAALLLTDVVDSTRLIETLGDQRGAEVWHRHDSLARELLAPHRGREIDKTDGFLLLFERADDALRYAAAYHAGLRQLSDELGLALAARAGLHVGDVVLRENPPEQVVRGAKPLEVEGIAKPTAARVMSVALAGQTLLSREAADELPEAGIEGWRLQSHGFWRLKGVATPVELLECGGADAPFVPPSDSPKVHRVVADGSGWRPVRDLPGNLGTAPDEFVGRAADLQALAAAVRPGGRVTLTGPPGVGKSRLAARYARSWAGDFPAGAWRVVVPSSASADEVAAAVSGTIGEAPVEGALVLLDGLDEGEVPAFLTPAAVLVCRRTLPAGARGRVLPLAPLDEDDAVALYRARNGAGDAVHAARLVAVLGGAPGPIERAARSSRDPSGDGPYRGLASFRVEDADLFFGRDSEARGLAERIAATSLVTVTGASGAGKTSLLQAGVRRFMPGRAILTMRPGGEPVAALDRVLAEAPVDGPVVLVVDQAEELVTIAALEARVPFAKRLVSLADDGRFTVVLAVRGDFFARLAELAPLRGLYSSSVEVVVAPGPEALREILVQPLARFGWLYEDDALVDRMVAAVADEPAALALLQFCASRLWAGRAPGTLLLTHSAYEQVGGVEGAMAAHAEETLAGFTAVQRREARRLLLRLITEERTRAPRSRTDLVESSADGTVAQAVLDRLVRSRLLSSFESEQGDAQIEIVHESLIRHWEQLERWLQEDQEGHRMHRALEAAASSWERRGHSVDLLWRGEVLAELQRWRLRTAPRLTRREDAFVLQSERAGARRTRQRWMAVGLSFVLLLSAVVGALVLWRRAEDAAVAAGKSAEVASLQHQLAVADRERIRGHGLAALRLSRDVLRRDPSAAAARTVLAAMTVGDDALLRLQSNTSDLYPPWSPSMDRFLIYEPEAWILDAAGARIAPVRADSSAWIIGAWSPDGRSLATRDAGRVWLWTRDGAPIADAPAGERLLQWSKDNTGVWVNAPEKDAGRTFVALDGTIRSAAKGEPRILDGPAAGRVLTKTGDGPVRLEDASGAVLATAPEGPRACDKMEAALSADGTRALTFAKEGCRDGVLELWGEGGLIGTYDTGRASQIKPIQWSPDAQKVAVIHGAGVLLLVDRDGVVSPTPTDLCERIDSVVWSPDSQRLALTCEFANRVALLDPHGAVVGGWGTNRTGDPDRAAGVHLAGWSADGSRFAAIDHTGMLGVWPADGPSPAFPSAETFGCTFSSDGSSVASLTKEGDHLLWRRSGERIGSLEEVGLVPSSPGTSVGDWSPDGTRWAAVVGGVLRLVETGTGERAGDTPVSVGAAEVLQWSPDGDRIAIIGANGAVLVQPATGQVDPLEGIAAGVSSRTLPMAAWSPDGSRLVVVQDEGAGWLFGRDGALLETLERDRNLRVHWHPSGESFFIAGSPWESTSNLYDRDGLQLREIDGAILAPWSPDTSTWVVSKEKRAFLTRADDGEVLAPMESRLWVWSAAWMPSGERLLVSLYGDVTSVWSAEGELLLELAGGESSGGCVDPKEEFVLTVGETGLTRWPIGDAALLPVADRLAPQGLLESDRRLLD